MSVPSVKINNFSLAAQKTELDLDEFQDDLFRPVMRQFMESVAHKIEIKHNEYLAICLSVEADVNPSPTTDHYQITNQARSSASPTKVIKVRAWVDGLDFFPMPGKLSELDTDPLVKMRPEFISIDKNIPIPSPLELIKVKWNKMTGDDPSTWSEPVYLGPYSSDGKRIIFPYQKILDLSGQQGEAAAAFDSTQQGVIQGNDPTTHSDPNVGYPNIVMPYYNSLQSLTWVYNMEKHLNSKEIYVDKKSDYSKIKKYDIIPYARPFNRKTEFNSTKQYRKKRLAFYLPDNVDIVRRKETRLFIVSETRGSVYVPYGDVYENPTMHYTISMNSNYDGSTEGLKGVNKSAFKKNCTIRVNVPYGLVINKNDVFSSKSVGCSVSSPVDGDGFLDSDSRWNYDTPTHELVGTSEFKKFKSLFHEWISSKKLPDGTKPYILGPFGTPGLRTGHFPNQLESINKLDDLTYFAGRLPWMRWGHYFLPDHRQAEALYELMTSIMENPPTSGYSWGFKTVKRHKQALTLNFPAIGTTAALPPTSRFIKKTKQGYLSEPAFPWGIVGKGVKVHNSSPYLWWRENLEKAHKGHNAVSGIVSISRWEKNQSPFLEHYLLYRTLGLGHMEAWYVTIAAAANTFSKKHGGLGEVPTPILKMNSTKVNEYLKKGQKMWFDAMKYNSDYTQENAEFTPPLVYGPHINELVPDNAIQPIKGYNVGE